MIKLLKVHMKDKSIFEMPNEQWQKAWNMKYSGDDEKEVIEIFTKVTEKHWKAKTIPTKFSWDDPWGRDYKNHADLGVDVMYPYVRAPLMAIVMEEMAKKMGKKTPKVVAIGENQTTEYTGHSAKKIKNLEEILEE